MVFVFVCFVYFAVKKFQISGFRISAFDDPAGFREVLQDLGPAIRTAPPELVIGDLAALHHVVHPARRPAQAPRHLLFVDERLHGEFAGRERGKRNHRPGGR